MRVFRPRKLKSVNEWLQMRRRREMGWTTAKLSKVYGISESMVRRHTKDLCIKEKPGTKRRIDYDYIARHPEKDAGSLARRFGVTRRGIQKARERLRVVEVAGVPGVTDGPPGVLRDCGGPC